MDCRNVCVWVCVNTAASLTHTHTHLSQTNTHLMLDAEQAHGPVCVCFCYWCLDWLCPRWLKHIWISCARAFVHGRKPFTVWFWCCVINSSDSRGKRVETPEKVGDVLEVALYTVTLKLSWVRRTGSKSRFSNVNGMVINMWHKPWNCILHLFFLNMYNFFIWIISLFIFSE